MRAFHVRRSARDAARFDDEVFTDSGHVHFEGPADLYRFAEAFAKNHEGHGPAPSAAEIFAAAVLHEVQHAVLRRYRETHGSTFDDLPDTLARGGTVVDDACRAFLALLPPPAVYRGERTAEEELARNDDDGSGRVRILEELFLLRLANENPAFENLAPLVSDEELRREPAYVAVVAEAEHRLATAPRLAITRDDLVDGATTPPEEDLFSLLRAPMRAAPASLSEQLAWVKTHWTPLLQDSGLAPAHEMAEHALRDEGLWHTRTSDRPGATTDLRPAPDFRIPDFHAEFGPGLGGRERVGTPADMAWAEPEQFSEDRDWMPDVVMIAKSTFVWLEQLAREYARDVKTLADVPDDALAKLRARGYNALWLIGVWERSAASQAIKQRMGNADAIASAYSLKSYSIAKELGGHAAYENLRDRAAKHGLRLASDMVPNHFGIDSDWVIDHPERFLQVTAPPFPVYRFEGPDLSSAKGKASIRIEDGYWNRSDAAVVFRRDDAATGEVAYIYHGNDGTSTPWNDTAQLDYLREETREAVIETILDVARMFPIIRFDAAMTLAKRHVKRLWYPEPGSSDGIPSRAFHAMTEEQFDLAMPHEFWREVVDRIAKEVPDTLLLAEAFWLMEGFFVRTLGMHRVYNSAFMHMLRHEKNDAYRELVRKVLDFDAGVLARYVNFLNNPDEETAAEQFGDGDKYFGAATLLATTPGLPMFGHGQWEGWHEKYGMEYRKARWNEPEKPWVTNRHDREIAPLLHDRALFAGVTNFRAFETRGTNGEVDADVIAHVNGDEERRVLVIFRNAWGNGPCRLFRSVPFRLPSGDVMTSTLAEALGLDDRGIGDDALVELHDPIRDLTVSATAGEIRERGLAVDLGGYAHRTFVWPPSPFRAPKPPTLVPPPPEAPLTEPQADPRPTDAIEAETVAEAAAVECATEVAVATETSNLETAATDPDLASLDAEPEVTETVSNATAALRSVAKVVVRGIAKVVARISTRPPPPPPSDVDSKGPTEPDDEKKGT